jgi:hypothetical protein
LRSVSASVSVRGEAGPPKLPPLAFSLHLTFILAGPPRSPIDVFSAISNPPCRRPRLLSHTNRSRTTTIRKFPRLSVIVLVVVLRPRLGRGVERDETEKLARVIAGGYFAHSATPELLFRLTLTLTLTLTLSSSLPPESSESAAVCLDNRQSRDREIFVRPPRKPLQSAQK